MEGFNLRFNNASTPAQPQPFFNPQDAAMGESAWWRGLNVRLPITQPLPPLPVGEFGNQVAANTPPPPPPQSNFTPQPQVLESGNSDGNGGMVNGNTAPMPHSNNGGTTVVSEPHISSLPPALANYKLVVIDKNLFMTTLKKHLHDMNKILE